MKIVITGSTGMVGKSVLLACLANNSVTEIVLFNRSAVHLQSTKITEVIISSFEEIAQYTEELKNVNAVYHCMGVSAVGLSEKQYHKFTFEYTQILADAVFENSKNAVFTYVSGVGTDSSETGNSMWARVKGKTENYILNKGFKDAYAFRPGGILPPKGVKSKTRWYNALYVVLRPFFPLLQKSKHIVTGIDIGKAMLAVTQKPVNQKVIDPILINQLASTQP